MNTKLGIVGIIIGIVLGSAPKYQIDAPLSACSGTPKPRPSIYHLTDSQWDAYVKAIKTLDSGTRPTKWDQFAKLHTDIYPDIHNKASFLAWHRAFLYAIEKELQKVDPSIMIPYWDWTYHSQNPEKDPVFEARRFGGNGDLNDNSCIKDGAFKSMPVYFDGTAREPQEHCIRRKFDKQADAHAAWLGPDLVNGLILKSKTFNDLWHQIENGPHGVIHNGIGADFSGHASPSDPLFYSHHAFVDKLWHDWSKRYPDMSNEYSLDETVRSKSDNLNMFTYKVEDMIDAEKLCYTYLEDHYEQKPDGKILDFAEPGKEPQVAVVDKNELEKEAEEKKDDDKKSDETENKVDEKDSENKDGEKKSENKDEENNSDNKDEENKSENKDEENKSENKDEENKSENKDEENKSENNDEENKSENKGEENNSNETENKVEEDTKLDSESGNPTPKPNESNVEISGQQGSSANQSSESSKETSKKNDASKKEEKINKVTKVTTESPDEEEEDEDEEDDDEDDEEDDEGEVIVDDDDNEDDEDEDEEDEDEGEIKVDAPATESFKSSSQQLSSSGTVPMIPLPETKPIAEVPSINQMQKDLNAIDDDESDELSLSLRIAEATRNAVEKNQRRSLQFTDRIKEGLVSLSRRWIQRKSEEEPSTPEPESMEKVDLPESELETPEPETSEPELEASESKMKYKVAELAPEGAGNSNTVMELPSDKTDAAPYDNTASQPLKSQLLPYTEVECDEPTEQAQYDLEYVTAGVKAPLAYDRTDQIHIRVPNPQPVAFLKKMGLNVPLVRQMERRFALYMDKLNRDPNYVSPAALINEAKFPKLPPVSTKHKRCRRRRPQLTKY